MQQIPDGTLMFAAVLILFSIIILWWSSSLMFDRRSISGGAHILPLGIITAYAAGSFFYNAVDLLSLIVLVVLSFSTTLFAWWRELCLRKSERDASIIL